MKSPPRNSVFCRLTKNLLKNNYSRGGRFWAISWDGHKGLLQKCHPGAECLKPLRHFIYIEQSSYCLGRRTMLRAAREVKVTIHFPGHTMPRQHPTGPKSPKMFYFQDIPGLCVGFTGWYVLIKPNWRRTANHRWNTCKGVVWPAKKLYFLLPHSTALIWYLWHSIKDTAGPSDLDWWVATCSSKMLN